MAAKSLTIIQINDTHAYLNLHPELFWERGQAVYRPAGGYARLATLIAEIRAENPGRTLLVDGGDTFHGTYPAVQTQGRALVPILNALAPDAMTAHWEFAYTPDGFKQLAAELDYPVLALNAFRQADGELFFEPYRVFEVGGLRVGLAGIAAVIVGRVMPEHFSRGLRFTAGRDELPGVIARLRAEERVDLAALVSHLGFPQDMQLMLEAPGMDVDLSAHTHHRLERAVRQGATLVTQAGSHGSFLTRLDLTVDGGRVTDYRHRLIEVGADVEPHPEVQALVETARAPFAEQLDEVVGETRTPLNRMYNLETTMDNFLLAALLEHTGAQVAFSNGWRYGAPILPGPVRLDDLYNMAPMDPPVATVELTGAELREMLEANLEHTFSRDPFNQMGGYVKRALGLRVFFKVENPPYQRIHKLFVGAEEAQPDKLYRAAFVTTQGVPAKYGENRRQLTETLIPVLRAYLQKHSPLEVGLAGTFTVI